MIDKMITKLTTRFYDAIELVNAYLYIYVRNDA